MTDPKNAKYIVYDANSEGSVVTTEATPDTKPEYFVFDAGNNEYYEFANEEEALRMAVEILEDCAT